MLISIVTPVFNEETNLLVFMGRLKASIRELQSKYDIEVIAVDDGSTDGSLEVLRDFSKHDHSVRTVALSRNFGHQSALLAGLAVARGQAIVTLDSDLQDPPEIIPQLIASWENGADVVHAQRSERRGETFFKKLSANIFYRFLDKLTEVDIPRNVGDFRLVDRRVLDQINQLTEKSIYLRGLVSWIGFEQVTVSFQRDPRHSGTTKYPLRKMFALALDAIFSFSERPLRLVTRVGVAVTSIAFVVVLYYLASFLFWDGNRAPGWLSVILSTMILGGIQIACLGVVGEYICRIFRDTKNRPLFIIDQLKSSNL